MTDKLKRPNYMEVKLEGKKVIIRAYRLSDFKLILKSNNERLPRQNRFDEPIATSLEPNRESFKKRLASQRMNAKKNQHFVFGIFSKKNGEYLGQIDLYTINEAHRWVNLGCQIQNHFWGKGHATEACALGLKLAFEKYNFYRVEAATELTNKAAIKSLKKSAMLREGVRRKFFSENGGIDMVVFATNAIDFYG